MPPARRARRPAPTAPARPRTPPAPPPRPGRHPRPARGRGWRPSGRTRRGRSARPRRPPKCRRAGSALVELHDRTQLDLPVLGARALLRPLDRLVEVRDVEHVVAAELLLGLREGPVGDERL